MTIHIDIVLVMAASIVVCNTECPGTEWTMKNDKCYYIAPTKMNWQRAVEFCKTLDTLLISPKTEIEFNNIFSMSAKIDSYWIGLDDIITEGVFIWQDGTKLRNEEQKWRSMQPDSFYPGEDCIEMWPDGWNDADCHYSKHVMCQAKSDFQSFEYALVPVDTHDNMIVHLDVVSSDTSSDAVTLEVQMENKRFINHFSSIAEIRYSFLLTNNEVPQMRMVSNGTIYIKIKGTRQMKQFSLKVRYNNMASMNLYPVQSAGNYYRVVTYCQVLGSCILGFAGLRNQSTEIKITLPMLKPTSTLNFQDNKYGSGDTIIVHLQEFEVAWIECKQCDLTNTVLESSNNFVVFAGGLDTVVRKGTFESTFLTQLPPVQSWGKKFILVNSGIDDGGDIYRIISRFDTTQVSIDGHNIIQMKNTSQWIQKLVEYGDVFYITANKPVMVTQYIYNDNNNAAMMNVPPIEQYGNITMVIPCKGQNKLIVDSNTRSLQHFNSTLVSNSGFSIYMFDENSFVTNICHIGPDDGHTFSILRNAWNDANFSFIDVMYISGYELLDIPVAATKAMEPGDLVDNDGDGLIDEDDCSAITDSFEYKTGEKKFSDAINACSDRNMMLAKLDTDERHRKAMDYFRRQGILSLSDPILIGLSKSNSQYTWPDGEELTYSNWDIGQPLDISLDFACVIVNGFDLSKSSRWKIGSCDVKYTYLCTKWADFSGKDCKSKESGTLDSRGTSFIFPVWDISSVSGTVDVEIAVHSSSRVTLFTYIQGQLNQVENIEQSFSRTFSAIGVNFMNSSTVFRIETDTGSDEISVHLMLRNILHRHKSLSTILYPTDTWGLEYFAASFNAPNVSSFCLITTLTSFTKVDFVLQTDDMKVILSQGSNVETIENTVSFSISLSKFEFVHLQSDQDLTGTYIRGENPISVFCGAEGLSFVLGEQLLPVQFYRKNGFENIYPVFSTDLYSTNVQSYIRILSSQRHTICTIRSNGLSYFQSIDKRGGFIDIQIDVLEYKHGINCSHPVLVWSVSKVGRNKALMTLVPAFSHYSLKQTFRTFNQFPRMIQELFIQKMSGNFPLLYSSTSKTTTSGFVSDLIDDMSYEFTTKHDNITFFLWNIGISSNGGFGTQITMLFTKENICELHATADEDCDGKIDEERCILLGYNFSPEKFLLSPGKYLPDYDNDGNYDEDCFNIIPDCKIPNISGTTVGQYTAGDPTYVTSAYGSLECIDGYSKVNASVQEVVCQSDGKWKPEIVCRQDCQNPEVLVNNSQTNETYFKYGRTYEMTCYNGYRLVGNPLLTCLQDAEWSHALFSCSTSCGDPRIEIPYSFLSSVSFETSFIAGTIITMGCNTSTTMIGNSNMMCLEGGEWDHMIKCIPDCADPRTKVEVDNATLLGFTLGSSSAYNVSYRFRCNLKFKMIGEGSIACLENSSWSQPQFYCKPCKCPCRRIGTPRYTEATSENKKLIDYETKSELSLDEKGLSKYRRTKRCAPNKKQKEKSIGYGGALFLSSTLIFIILIDLPTLVAHVKHLLRRPSLNAINEEK